MEGHILGEFGFVASVDTPAEAGRLEYVDILAVVEHDIVAEVLGLVAFVGNHHLVA